MASGNGIAVRDGKGVTATITGTDVGVVVTTDGDVLVHPVKSNRMKRTPTTAAG